MYEKNCLNYGFITQLKHAKHVIVLQMHPSSQQEKAQLFEKLGLGVHPRGSGDEYYPPRRMES